MTETKSYTVEVTSDMGTDRLLEGVTREQATSFLHHMFGRGFWTNGEYNYPVHRILYVRIFGC